MILHRESSPVGSLTIGPLVSRRLAREEETYGDIFPLVQLLKGHVAFFLVLTFAGAGLLTLLFFHDHWAGARSEWSGSWDDTGPAMVAWPVIMGGSFWISFSICRMSKWLGAAMRIFSLGGMAFLGLYSAVVLWMDVTAIVRHEILPMLWTFTAALPLVFVPALYVNWCVLKAARRLTAADSETRRMVAESEVVGRTRCGYDFKSARHPDSGETRPQE